MNNQSRMPYQRCLWAVALLIATSPVCAMLLSESQKIWPSDWRYCDAFGADIAIDGDTALVSAFSGDCYTNYGQAYELSRSPSGTWLESAKLTPPPEADPEQGQGFPTLSFGWAVALTGNRAIIGAPWADRPTPEGFWGRVFTLARSAVGWRHEAIIGDDSDIGLGRPVAVDGNTAISGSSADSVEIWAREAQAWTRQARIDVDDRGWGRGGRVALALDGHTAVIGRTVYVRSGSVWREQARLAAADGRPYDGLGDSVALDGDVVVLGAPGVDRGGVTNAGAAYVFRRSGSTWREEAKIVSTDLTSEFGAHVALDGNTIIIGARRRDHGQPVGHMYVRSDGAWRERATLAVSDDSRCWDSLCYDHIGDLALSGDTVLVGWPGADGPIVNSMSLPYVGAVHVFDLSTVDSDADGIADVADNCIDVVNADQADFDGDGSGDACDPDIDGDAVANGADVCGYTKAGDTVHPDTGCSLAQRCPCNGPRASDGSWRNHGMYVSCVDKGAGELSELGLIADAELEAIVTTAAQSACGFRNR